MVTGIVEKQKEKTVVCHHKESVDRHGRGECGVCHQVRQYNLEFPTRAPEVIKRGRINGVLTEVLPGGVYKEFEGAAKVTKKVEPRLSEEAQHIPENWKTLSNQQRHAWIVEHREAIAVDLEAIGRQATADKWGIPGGTLGCLAMEWGVKAKDMRRESHLKVQTAPAPPPPTEVITKAECVPANWRTLSKIQKGDWLEKHRKPITADLVTIGGLATIEKWGLPVATIYTLARRWGVHPARPGRGIASAIQGEVPQPTEDRAPANWDEMPKGGKIKWLVKYRKPITADLEAIGVLATAKKWNLPEGTLGGRARIWDVKVAKMEQRRRPTKKVETPLAKEPIIPIDMPSFPAFNEGWTEKMKMAWLRAYTSCRVAETEGSKK